MRNYGNDPTEKITTHIRYHYLTVPAMVQMTLGRNVQFFVRTGISGGFLLRQTFVTESFDDQPKSTFNNTDNNNRFDIGLSTGIGGKVPLSERFSFHVELRDHWGLSNISKAPVINDGTVKPHSITLLLGLTYRPAIKSKKKIYSPVK